MAGPRGSSEHPIKDAATCSNDRGAPSRSSSASEGGIWIASAVEACILLIPLLRRRELRQRTFGAAPVAKPLLWGSCTGRTCTRAAELGLNPESLTLRQAGWRDALHAIADEPLIGHGWATAIDSGQPAYNLCLERQCFARRRRSSSPSRLHRNVGRDARAGAINERIDRRLCPPRRFPRVAHGRDDMVRSSTRDGVILRPFRSLPGTSGSATGRVTRTREEWASDGHLDRLSMALRHRLIGSMLRSVHFGGSIRRPWHIDISWRECQSRCHEDHHENQYRETLLATLCS